MAGTSRYTLVALLQRLLFGAIVASHWGKAQLKALAHATILIPCCRYRCVLAQATGQGCEVTRMAAWTGVVRAELGRVAEGGSLRKIHSPSGRNEGTASSRGRQRTTAIDETPSQGKTWQRPLNHDLSMAFDSLTRCVALTCQ